MCQRNKWDNFLVPLHTLKIGLQHKQVDTVKFFLKSRSEGIFQIGLYDTFTHDRLSP